MTAPLRETFVRAVESMTEAMKRAGMELANRLDRGRQARIEAELDRKQEELRGTVLRLADALGMEAHEARKALIRESYLASGRLPRETSDS